MPASSKQRRSRPAAADITPETLIWCPACRRIHPAKAFNKESRRYSGLATICREAQAAKRKTPEGRAKTKDRNRRRWANPSYREATLAAAKARRKVKGQADLRRARARLQAIVDEWKTQGCVDCGYEDIRAIDPDHLDGTTKSGHLSRLVQLCASAARIRAELEKCTPRCARCHRLITQTQRPCAWRTATRVPPSWRQRLEMQDRNDAMKLATGCTDCGWQGWARGLDWDHVRGSKVRSIATLIANGRSWSEVLEEIAKCELVCANCHRIRTSDRRLERPCR